MILALKILEWLFESKMGHYLLLALAGAFLWYGGQWFGAQKSQAEIRRLRAAYEVHTTKAIEDKKADLENRKKLDAIPQNTDPALSRDVARRLRGIGN